MATEPNGNGHHNKSRKVVRGELMFDSTETTTVPAETSAPTPSPVKRKRGRPKGSKNKPKM